MRATLFTIVGFLFLAVVSTAALAAEKKADPKAPKVGMVFTLGGRRLEWGILEERRQSCVPAANRWWNWLWA